MNLKCPYCGHENIAGSDHCSKCLHSFTDTDLPQPGKDKLQKIIMTKAVGDLVLSQQPPIIVSRETSMQEIVEKMQGNPKKGCVLICDKNKKLLGIISIRDIALKVAGVIENMAACSAEKIMTPNPECLDKTATLGFALHKMSIGKFRHVPVLDNGIPIGVVSTRDIIDCLSDKKA